MNESNPTRAKVGLEVGIIISAALFLLGIAFNAGIEYGRIDDLYHRDDQRARDIQKVQAEVNQLAIDTPSQLSAIKTKLDDLITLEHQRQGNDRRNSQ
jgi:hypothetical protein